MESPQPKIRAKLFNLCALFNFLKDHFFDYLILFDHSCGHDRQCEDGLNVAKMSKSFGGKQCSLCNTEIKQEQGYLGPYPQQLNVGNLH